MIVGRSWRLISSSDTAEGTVNIIKEGTQNCRSFTTARPGNDYGWPDWYTPVILVNTVDRPRPKTSITRYRLTRRKVGTTGITLTISEPLASDVTTKSITDSDGTETQGVVEKVRSIGGATMQGSVFPQKLPK